MRAIWSGGISFGLVYIPVKLYSGVSSQGLNFDMLREKDQCPIKYMRVCKNDGEEVPWNQIVKGYKLEDEYYVVLKDEDFEKASSEKTNTIEIVNFVKVEEISPRYFEKPYLIEPGKGAGKTYNLLKEAMLRSGMAGVAKFVMRNKEHLALLMADEDVIFLNQMRFHDELRDPGNLKLPAEKPAEKELDLALKIIEQMSSAFDPGEYKDTYQEKLKEIIEAKAKNQEVSIAHEQPEATAVEDLMEQLKKSLQTTS